METKVSLVKGDRVDLTKTNPGMKVMAIGLGWDTKAGGGADFDLDAFALALTAGKLKDAPGHILYFGSPKTANKPTIMAGALVHSGDNLTGAGAGDDETILIETSKLTADVDQIIICVNIFEATSRRQNFGMVENAFCRIYDWDTKVEIARFDLTEDASGKTALVFGKVYLKDGEWKFQAIGEGKDGDINDVAQLYV